MRRERPAARPELKGLPVYEPGRSAAPGAVKLASNENPHGPSPKVRQVLKSFRAIERYPDGGCSRLRERLAAHLALSPSGILVGAGSDEIGDLLARAYLRPGDAVVYPRYTFVRYGMAAQSAGARQVVTRVRPDFSIDVDHLIDTVRAVRPKMVCLANPNNPTGAYVRKSDLRAFMKHLPRRTLFVLDEAYFEYAKLTPDYPDGLADMGDPPNLVVLRTFSKIYGLASLRVGYAAAHPSVISELHKVRPPFNVSAVAQAAAESALSDQRHVLRCARLNERERARMSARLSAMGFRVYPTPANFLMVGLRKADPPGRAFFERLARRGVIVRDLVPYGLPAHIRVTIGARSENDRLLGIMGRM